MSYIIAVAKQGKDAVTDTNPNDFVFHSSYNTFKIVRRGLMTCVLTPSTNGQMFSEPHFLPFTPLVTAMAKESGYDHAFPPNSPNVYLYGVKAGLFNTGVKFIAVYSNATYVKFEFDNSSGTPKTVYVRYYCIEQI